MVRSRATFFSRRRLIVKKKCRIFLKRRHPLSGERNGTMGLLRVRLHEKTRGNTANSRSVTSQHFAVAAKRSLDRLYNFVSVALSDAIRRSSFRASSLVGSCFIPSRSKSTSKSERGHTQRIYASRCVNLFLDPRGKRRLVLRQSCRP